MSGIFLGTAAINKLAALGTSVVLATPRIVKATVITGGALLASKKLEQSVNRMFEKRRIRHEIRRARRRLKKDFRDPKVQKELKKEFRRMEMKFSLRSLRETQKKIENLKKQEMRELSREMKQERELRR